MALARVGAESVMGPLLPRVADQIKEAISVKGRTRPNCPEALQVHAVTPLRSMYVSATLSLLQGGSCCEGCCGLLHACCLHDRPGQVQVLACVYKTHFGG